MKEESVPVLKYSEGDMIMFANSMAANFGSSNSEKRDSGIKFYLKHYFQSAPVLSEEEIKKQIAEILRADIYYSAQVETYVIHGAVENIFKLMQTPVPVEYWEPADEQKAQLSYNVSDQTKEQPVGDEKVLFMQEVCDNDKHTFGIVHYSDTTGREEDMEVCLKCGFPFPAPKANIAMEGNFKKEQVYPMPPLQAALSDEDGEEYIKLNKEFYNEQTERLNIAERKVYALESKVYELELNVQHWKNKAAQLQSQQQESDAVEFANWLGQYYGFDGKYWINLCDIKSEEKLTTEQLYNEFKGIEQQEDKPVCPLCKGTGKQLAQHDVAKHYEEDKPVQEDKWRIKEDNICPATNEQCDDECCPVGAVCNLHSGEIQNISKPPQVAQLKNKPVEEDKISDEEIEKLAEKELGTLPYETDRERDACEFGFFKGFKACLQKGSETIKK